MGKDRINSGGAWLWAGHVNRTNGQHKLLMAQQRAFFCAPERAEKNTFLERPRGFCRWLLNLVNPRRKKEKLLHQDLERIRNCVDLLLDDIDYTEPVEKRYFLPVAERPYGEILSRLINL